MIKSIILKVKENIWLIPSAYCILSTLLAVTVIWLDTVHGEKIQDVLSSDFLVSVELSQTILGTIAASLLTMITITFSTIMVVLTTYSSQFSPRTLTDFITNKVTMRVLGVYMGGFIYSILTLLFMREDIEHEVIAGPIGVIYSIICLAFFAFFIHHVATSIQVNKLVSDLTSHTLKTIRERNSCENGNEKKKGKISYITHPPNFYREKQRVEVFKSENFGYIQLINYDHLFSLAKKHDLTIEVHYTIGTFITENKPVFTVYFTGMVPHLDIRRCIEVGIDRTMLQDVDFGIQKVVEITLRALSPSINDPNTAIDGIRHLGKLLAEACKTDGRFMVYSDEGKVRLLAVQNTFEEQLYATFYQIVHYGRTDVSVMIAIIEALNIIAEETTEGIRKKLWQFYQYVDHSFDRSVLQPLDQYHLNKKLEKFKKLTH